MKSAKLRRSRDVPKHNRSKIGKRFEISSLAMFQHGLFSPRLEGESVPQSPNLQVDRSFPIWPGRSVRLTYLVEGQPAGTAWCCRDSPPLPCPAT